MASGGAPAQTTETAAHERLSGLKSPLQQAPGLALGNTAPHPRSPPSTLLRPSRARLPDPYHGSRPGPQAWGSMKARLATAFQQQPAYTPSQRGSDASLLKALFVYGSVMAG